MNSSQKRSWVKSITWRIVATISTFVIGYALTSSWTFATSLTLISTLINFVLYYIHERIWLQVKWGRQ